MRLAILLSGRHLEPHHCHFLAKLRNSTDIIGGISFPKRAGRRLRLIKKLALREPSQIIALAIGRLQYNKIRKNRLKAFEKDQSELGDLNVVDVRSMEDAAEQAEAWGAEVLFNLSGGFIREPLLSATPYGVLGFHHGIMPLLRGLASAFWAISMDRPECLGITLQRLCKKLDEGTILAQKNVAVKRQDSLADITLRLDKAGSSMIEPTMKQLQTRKKGLEPPPGERIYRSNPKLIHQLLFPWKLRKFCYKHGS